jgi:hypothetical protein
MEQTYGFFGFILYLLSFLGCSGGGTYNNSPPVIEKEAEAIEETTAPLQYQADYDRSLKQWNQEKKEHKNSYEYTLFFENSASTYRCSTILVVKNGTVYSREKRAYVKNAQTNKIEPLKKETWVENQKQLGTHDDLPKTLDELYKDCSNTLLVDSKSNHIVFTMADNQLMSVCGHSHTDCAGDCFKGVTIQDFKWLD